MAVFLLHLGAHQQQKQHIAHIVGVAGMAQHVTQHADIGQRIIERGAVHAEKTVGGNAAGDAVQNQRSQAQCRKGEDHRGVKADDKSSQWNFLFSNVGIAIIMTGDGGAPPDNRFPL